MRNPFSSIGLLGIYLVIFFLAWASSHSAYADGYAELAVLIARPLHKTVEEAREGQSNEAIMLRLEAAQHSIDEVDRSATGADAIYLRASAALDDASAALATIHELNGCVPDYLGTLEKTARASPALYRSYKQQAAHEGDKAALQALASKGFTEVVKLGANRWQLTKQWNEYRNHYSDLREASLELAPIAKDRPTSYGMGLSYTATDDGPRSVVIVDGLAPDGPASAAGLRLGDKIVAVGDVPMVDSGKLHAQALRLLEPAAKDTRVRLRIVRGMKTHDIDVVRGVRLDDVPDLLTLRLRGSCDGAFDADLLALTNNSGADLTCCTVVVTLKADSASEHGKRHLHFVNHWPAGQTLFAVYHNQRSARIARDESPLMVKEVAAALYSDQFQGTIHYRYWDSQDRYKDMKRYCETNYALSAKFLPETDGLLTQGDGLYQQDAALRVWLGQVAGKPAPRLVPRQVSVQLHKKGKSRSASWDGSVWDGGTLGYKDFASSAFSGFGSPDSYEVRLRFFGTDYEHRATFKP